MGREERNISIKRIMTTVLMASLVVTISILGYLIFLNWHVSAKETTRSISNSIGASIDKQISTLIHAPYHVNQVSHFHLENGSYDMTDQLARKRFFVGVLEAHDKNIYSFSYGTREGHYYGARRNENGKTEIMRNNNSTGGESWYYSLKDDNTADQRVVVAGSFDPRTRDWYKAAAELGKPTFSPVYKHFVMDDLSISAAWPIYNGDGQLEGVLGTHMLLDDIGLYLEETMEEFSGNAVIVERESGNLIANSFGMKNFTIGENGEFRQLQLSEIDKGQMLQAYEHFGETSESSFRTQVGREDFHINAKAMDTEGIDWLIIAAIPESLLMDQVNENIGMTIVLALAALTIFAIIFNLTVKKLYGPIEELLSAAEKLSSGDLSQRVDIKRHDEVGRISKSFNKVAEKMQYLINNLEDAVKERTNQLDKAYGSLEENKDNLQLILNSTAEAIYGIDLNGNCTFTNKSCIELLGYNYKEDLLGKNIHKLIHHSHKDGSLMKVEDCKIVESMKQGQGVKVDDEVFWRRDGTPIQVEYHSYPQIRYGQVIGAVVTFMDIRERKERKGKSR